MGKEVASAYVTIGANTSGFKDSLSKIDNSLKNLTGVSLKAATSIGAIGTVVKKGVEYLRQAIEETTAYNARIVDQARLVGITTEEMSRLAQAADDVFISEGTLNAALLAASRQGIDVSTESLKKLSEQYLALAPGAERAQFLTQTFGRSGADMGKLMELGANGIDKATKAINGSLVVTQKAANNSILFKKAMDALNDSLQEVKYSIGNDVTPVLSDFSLVLADLIDRTKETGFGLNDFLTILQLLNPLLVPIISGLKGIVTETGDYADQLRKSDGALKNYVKHIGEIPAAVKLSEEYIKAMTSANEKFIQGVAGFQSIDDDYNQNAKDNMDEMLGLYEERAKLIKAGYSEQSQAIKDIDKALDDNAKKAEANAAAKELATRKIILGYLEQKLAIDGLDERETEYLLQKGVDWGIYSDTAIQEMKNAWAEADNLASAINGIPDKTVKINVHTVYSESGHPINLNGGSGTGGGNVTQQNSAIGADFFVPPGFPNDSYRMGVQSGERVKVEPASKVMETGKQAGIDYDKMASTLVYALKRAGAFA